jgi:hypothetical protein
MLTETLQQLRSDPIKIQIQGRGLIYRVDLTGGIKTLDKKIHFQLEGSVRFGVWSSPGLFSSVYQLQDGAGRLLEHDINFPRIRFHESYRLKGDGLQFTKGVKTPVDLDGSNPDLMEPLPLLFKMLCVHESQVEYQGPLLVGGKMQQVKFLKDHHDFQVILDGRVLFQGNLELGHALLRIPRLKVDLEVFKV